MKNVYKFYDEELGRHKYFITEYPGNDYIEKTVTYLCELDSYDGQNKPGRIEVHMRNGRRYIIECWVTYYTTQYGIQVSHDGQFVYVNSDEKGLWCYTYRGELVWKTRYTSVSYVIPHPNNSITCVTTTKILIIDCMGNIIKQVPIYREGMSEMASDTIIVSNTSENVISVFDGYSLNVLYKISLKALGLDYILETKLENDTLTIEAYSLKKQTVTVIIDLKNDPSVIQKYV